MDDRSTVLCLGDSHTCGMLGGDWVRSLSDAFPSLRFINTGVNGTQAANVLKFLPSHLAAISRTSSNPPAVITLLIGTNDCLRSLARDAKDFWGEAHYWWLNGDTGLTTLEAYTNTVRSILTHITDWPQQLQELQLGQQQKQQQQPQYAQEEKRTGDPAQGQRQQHLTKEPVRQIKLFVITLPPIGEDLDDVANQQVEKYNTALKAVVQEAQQRQLKEKPEDGQQQEQEYARVEVETMLLDLNAQCRAAIRRASTAPTAAGSGNAACAANQPHKTNPAAANMPNGPSPSTSTRSCPPRRLPPSFLSVGFSIVACAVRRYLWGLSYDQQSRAAGTSVLSADCVHLSDAGGELLRGLLEPHMRNLAAARKAP